VLGRTDIGEIAVGKQADLALFALGELRFSGCEDPLAALVLSGMHAASHVMVAGRWIVREGRLETVDVNQLHAQHHQASMRLSAAL
jgi:8-oxoguanine deaminase